MKTWHLLKNNPHLFQRYFIKEYLIKSCRRFFEERNYHELESPILVPQLPQERHINLLEVDMELKKDNKDFIEKVYVTPTTETFNKKILAAGLGEHFVITKVARGLEEIGINHLPEFTMLEWYHLNANYKDLMRDCEELFLYTKRYIGEMLEKEKNLNRFMIDSSRFLNNSNIIRYQGADIDLTPPWDRLSVSEGLKKYSDMDLDSNLELDQIRNTAKKKGYNIDEDDDWQTIFELIFASEVEANLSKNKPTFIYDYPKILCPLTRENPDNPNVCEKVELYILGKEIANGYTELIDGNEQEKRFNIEKEARALLGKKPIKTDNDLVDAIKSGLPDVAGIGMGLDRVAMIFADAKSISEINYFPGSEWF